jgi:hypothetical protein
MYSSINFVQSFHTIYDLIPAPFRDLHRTLFPLTCQDCAVQGLSRSLSACIMGSVLARQSLALALVIAVVSFTCSITSC